MLDALPSDEIAAHQQQHPPVSALAGLRWCDCSTSAYDTATVYGRRGCASDPLYSCLQNGSEYESSEHWHEIETATNGDWNQGSVVGDEWLMEFSDGPVSILWDFRSLPNVHGCGSLSTTRFS